MNRSQTDVAQPTRETFSLSRTVEYLSEAELTKQIGYPRHMWLLAVAKELIDNSMDHCEELRRLPEITITLTKTSLSVRDNGDGIPADTVAAMLNFDQRVSSREAYRCPTRGAQGNAGKCLVAIPYILGGEAGTTTIEAQGTRHEIAVRLDPLAQRPVVEHRGVSRKVQPGTFVEVHFGESASSLGDAELDRFVLFCRDYAVLNPHLSVVLELPDRKRSWHRTTEVISKWSAAEAEPAGWHNIESFERLAAASITNDRKVGRDRLLRDFVRQFSGLKRSDALKKVFDEAELFRANMSALVNCKGLDRDKTARLLVAMQKHGVTPNPEKIGAIGRNHFTQAFSALGGGKVNYKKEVGEDQRGLPFVIEAAFAETAGETAIITGCNFSPSIDRPVVQTLESLLERQKVEEDSAVALAIHITTVAPTYLDRGKCVVAVEGDLAAAIERCVTKVTAEYSRRRKREQRDAAAHRRWVDRLARSRPDCSLKSAISRVLGDAIVKASGGGACEFSDRDLYYAARELVQQYTSEPLTQSWFDKVVDEWEENNGLITGRLRDPRGFLLEPHTGRKIPLGTKAVDDYEIPAYLYDTIIYVEKKGLLAKFQLGQICERYDCAIIAAEGYAVRAAKALLHAAQQGHHMKVLCFHDADPHGYNIARTLSESTGAHRYEIEVIDAGLHIEEAVKMGLAVETFVRKVALPKGLELSDRAREHFTGKATVVEGRDGRPKRQYVDCKRVELNALSANPAEFLKWVEAKLKKHGVAKKLVPPKSVITQRVEVQRREILRRRIQQRFDEAIDMAALVDSVQEQLQDRMPAVNALSAVKEWSSKVRPEPWTKCVDEAVEKSVAKLDTAIRDEVAERLR